MRKPGNPGFRIFSFRFVSFRFVKFPLRNTPPPQFQYSPLI